jgi:cation transport protein ChaC
MDDALAQRGEDGPLWIFGYGSLVWNPLIVHSRMVRALLHGWHRSFCLKLLDGRANRDNPGRMLGLAPGGETIGFAFLIEEKNLLDELRIVWLREMVHGLYRPQWEQIELETGGAVKALTFVADTNHPLFQIDTSVLAVAPCIANACGPLGSNRHYLTQLEESLEEHGIRDAHISELVTAVRTSRVASLENGDRDN